MTSKRYHLVASALSTTALVVAGCSMSSQPETTSAPSSSGAATSTSAPANPALKTIDTARLRTVVENATREMLVPGALVLVRTPTQDVTVTVGTTQLGATAPPEAGTHFRIASNTKTMTAAVTVLLAQDGRLRFDDSVSTYLPDVPNGENITVAQLLRMRSGLYGYTADPALAGALDSDPGRSWTPREVLDIAFAHPPQFAPDTAYEYSNTNFALLGMVVEKVSGTTLSELFTERLYGPIGLRHTSLPATDDTTMPVPYSHGYMYGGSIYALADDPYPADIQRAARAGTLAPIDYTNQNSSYATAAGGAISTADDLATWIEALASGGVFNADYQKQWRDSLLPENPAAPDGQKYGYGISYQRFGPTAAMYYHGGELPGFNSFMGHDAENDVTLVIWTNLTLSPDGRTTANALLPTVLEEVYTGLRF